MKSKKTGRLLAVFFVVIMVFLMTPKYSVQAQANAPTLLSQIVMNEKETRYLRVQANKVVIKKIVWKSSDQSIVKIKSQDENEVHLQAKKKGTAKITATVSYKRGKKRLSKKLSCTVIVVEKGEMPAVLIYNKEKTSVIDVVNSGYATYAIVPDYVTCIESEAFSNCNKLKDITFSKNLTCIESRAFLNCDALESISLPEGLVEIGEGAFWDCVELESISLPESLIEIGKDAFRDCESLKSVIIPNGVTVIGEGAFADCENIKEIELPSSLTAIESYTFYWCDALTEVSIPENVKKINEYAFGYCDQLSKVTVSGPRDNIQIDNRAFIGCEKLKQITTLQE